MSYFRKPELFSVCEDLQDFGQPDTTVVSLDEFWIEDLAEAQKLERLEPLDSPSMNVFFEPLRRSGTNPNGVWSFPHFLDFGYYNCLREISNDLKPTMQRLRDINDASEMVESLKSRWNKILVYDFHTPDTTASVVLEFIEAFGAKVESLESLNDFVCDENIEALRLLRRMVGEWDATSWFEIGASPVEFEEIPETIPIVRGWHSRLSAMPKIRESHVAVERCAIPGTLGGWHLGLLKGSPSLTYAKTELLRIMSQDNQLQRLEQEAGLPTLSCFYRPDDNEDHRGKGRSDVMDRRDTVTEWTLEYVGEHIRSSIRRSDLRKKNVCDYVSVHGALSRLHRDIMVHDVESFDRIVDEWKDSEWTKSKFGT